MMSKKSLAQTTTKTTPNQAKNLNPPQTMDLETLRDLQRNLREDQGDLIQRLVESRYRIPPVRSPHWSE